MNEVPSLPIASVVVEYAFDLVLLLITDIVRVTPVFARQWSSAMTNESRIGVRLQSGDMECVVYPRVRR